MRTRAGHQRSPRQGLTRESRASDLVTRCCIDGWMCSQAKVMLLHRAAPPPYLHDAGAPRTIGIPTASGRPYGGGRYYGVW
jgi:hypothetical protein